MRKTRVPINKSVSDGRRWKVHRVYSVREGSNGQGSVAEFGRIYILSYMGMCSMRKSQSEASTVRQTEIVAAIDPSINRTGLAVFQGKQLSAYLLVRSKTKEKSEFEKAKIIYTQVREIVNQYGVNKIILEVPTHWEVAGYESRESGSLQKLSVVCGMLYLLGNVMTIYPHIWKRQIPKNVMRKRLMIRYPGIVTEKLDHNVMDAIGIGHWYVWKEVP